MVSECIEMCRTSMDRFRFWVLRLTQQLRKLIHIWSLAPSRGSPRISRAVTHPACPAACPAACWGTGEKGDVHGGPVLQILAVLHLRLQDSSVSSKKTLSFAKALATRKLWTSALANSAAVQIFCKAEASCRLLCQEEKEKSWIRQTECCKISTSLQ